MLPHTRCSTLFPWVNCLLCWSGVCGLTAVGVFLDHFLWDLDTPSIFVNVTQLNKGEALIIDNMTVDSFEYLLTTRGYRSAPSLLYSFYLEVAGVLQYSHNNNTILVIIFVKF